MATHTRVVCDIKNCGEEAFHKGKTLAIHFTTETTEGRAVPPYLERESLDLCKDHYQRYINLLPLAGEGAQGFNTYWFREDDE